jgi:hypothetical protein
LLGYARPKRLLTCILPAFRNRPIKLLNLTPNCMPAGFQTPGHAGKDRDSVTLLDMSDARRAATGSAQVMHHQRIGPTVDIARTANGRPVHTALGAGTYSREKDYLLLFRGRIARGA